MAPAQSKEPSRLAAGPATPLAPAGGPPTDPLLGLDTGMHTAGIVRIGIDAANRYLVTGSEDKTVRVWELASGRLLRALRPPTGAGNEGKIWSVALSPDGTTIGAGGTTGRAWDASYSVYLFDRESGRLLRRLTGLPNEVFHLAFSRDGRFLAAVPHGTDGMRLYRTQDYTQVASDKEYGDRGIWADFDATGRLVTTSWDGFIRMYDRNWRLQAKRKAPGGTRPIAAAFSPDGTRIAVGFEDSARVDVLSGQDLSPLYAPDITGVGNGTLQSVCWSADGQWLYAGGNYSVQSTNLIRRWAEGGKGAASNLLAAQNSITHIVPLTAGGVVFGAFEPSFGVLDATGKRRLFQGLTGADFRDNWQGFRIAYDSATVQFSYERAGQSPARFALHDRVLVLQPTEDPVLTLPVTSASGLHITGWEETEIPALNGKPLKLWPYERARSVAIAPDHQRFILAANWSLRLFDRQGVEQWRKPVPGYSRTVNIAGNGQVAVAIFNDGTLRWYRLRDGKELLAFFPHNDRKRWVLWTPTSYYDASPGAEDLIGWHVNRGRDAAADFFPAARFRSTFFRPDVVAGVLQTLDEAEALRRADTAAQRTQQTVEITKQLPPVIQVRTLQDGATVSTPTVTVRFSVRTPSREPVTAIKGLVDGHPVIQTQGLQMVGKEDELQEMQIPLFIDTCHAGNIMGQRRGLTDITRVVNELASTENGVVVFAASTGNQYCLEDQAWGNGAFTKALVEGLYSKADYPSAGRVTVTMLDLYLSERVKELTKGQQTPATVKPQSISDFPVALVQ